MSRPKYKHGQMIKTVEDVVRCYRAGLPIYFRHKVLTPAFYQNWSLKYIENCISHKHLCYAERKEIDKNEQ